MHNANTCNSTSNKQYHVAATGAHTQHQTMRLQLEKVPHSCHTPHLVELMATRQLPHHLLRHVLPQAHGAAGSVIVPHQSQVILLC